MAGLLTASENPERYLPSAFIQAVCYRGEMRDADQQLDARDIVGPIDRQIAIIIEKGRRNDNKEIEYRLFGDSELLLTIYASSASSLKVTERVTEKVTEKSLALGDRILAAIAEEPNLSQRELAEMFGVNRAYLARVMSAMQRKGLIRRIGPDKGGHWEVVKCNKILWLEKGSKSSSRTMSRAAATGTSVS